MSTDLRNLLRGIPFSDSLAPVLWRLNLYKTQSRGESQDWVLGKIKEKRWVWKTSAAGFVADTTAPLPPTASYPHNLLAAFYRDFPDLCHFIDNSSLFFYSIKKGRF